MPERVTRVMCQFCRGGGVVWAPRMAVQWGSREVFSLAAPTRCAECRGAGWFHLTGGTDPGGTGFSGADSGGSGPGGTDAGGTGPGGTDADGSDPGDADPGDAGPGGAGR